MSSPNVIVLMVHPEKNGCRVYWQRDGKFQVSRFDTLLTKEEAKRKLVPPTAKEKDESDNTLTVPEQDGQTPDGKAVEKNKLKNKT